MEVGSFGELVLSLYHITYAVFFIRWFAYIIRIIRKMNMKKLCLSKVQYMLKLKGHTLISLLNTQEVGKGQ
jgi:hypothetical protein